MATSAEVEKWPQPEIGDIVTFDGKWKGESAIGRIAMLQVGMMHKSTLSRT